MSIMTIEQREANYLPIPRMKSIYSISYDHQLLMQEIEDNEGEITPEIGDKLAINEKELQEKAVSYGYVMKQYDFEVAQIKSEIERLTALSKSKLAIKEELKSRIANAMQTYNIQKIDHANLKLSFLKSEQVVIDENAEIPTGFIKTKTTETTDVAGLKLALKAGHLFEGIRVVEKMNLQIK